jgi:hypothetical protein
MDALAHHHALASRPESSVYVRLKTKARLDLLVETGGPPWFPRALRRMSMTENLPLNYSESGIT